MFLNQHRINDNDYNTNNTRNLIRNRVNPSERKFLFYKEKIDDEYRSRSFKQLYKEMFGSYFMKLQFVIFLIVQIFGFR